MDINRRAEEKADVAINKSTFRAILISAGIGAAATITAAILQPWSGPIQDMQQRVSKVEGRLGSLGGKLTFENVEKRILEIENRLGIETE